MTVFRYDRSFDGLLTAVFDAYNRKQFPERLIGETDISPLFSEGEYSVITDTVKATRVWAGLQKRLPYAASEMLIHTWLSELPSSDELLFRYIRKIFDGGKYKATDFADADILSVKQIAHKVNQESLRVIQFARFQKTADGIYFAPASPVYNVLPLTVNHFSDRFAFQQWLVYDMKRRYGYFFDMKTATEVSFPDDSLLADGNLDESLLGEDEKMFQQAWKDYTAALTIRERLNPKLQRQSMPQRFWKFMPEKR
jgi:probable DNA metabolism protein